MSNLTKKPTIQEEKSTSEKIIYNFACGETHIPGAKNVDVNEEVKPDIVYDITVVPYKFAEENSADIIYWFHGIEHVEKFHHPKILMEFRRILKDDGLVHISYPEFSVCAKYWIENHQGKRDFWEKTVYGLQTNPFEYHISLMHTPELQQLMEEIGFEVISTKYEVDQDFNTILSAKKGPLGLTREEGVRKELFG